MSGKEHANSVPVDILSIQAHDDTTAPPDGRKFGLTMLPEAYTQSFYDKRMGVVDGPQVHTRTAADGTELTAQSRQGAAGSEVRTLWLSKGAHIWLGGKGAENTAVNVTDEIWNYLKEKWDKPT